MAMRFVVIHNLSKMMKPKSVNCLLAPASVFVLVK